MLPDVLFDILKYASNGFEAAEVFVNFLWSVADNFEELVQLPAQLQDGGGEFEDGTWFHCVNNSWN